LDADPGVWWFEAPARLYAASMFFTPGVLILEKNDPRVVLSPLSSVVWAGWSGVWSEDIFVFDRGIDV
jgi:hypothetical protein